MFRDPRYLAPLSVLIGVILLSAVLAQHGSKGSAAASAPSPAVAADTAEPTAIPTPDGAALDAHRLEDLVKVRDALLVYRRQHGKFPVTKNGVTTICAAPTDPGCVLSETGGVPFADGDQPYWFISDGARVALVARAATAFDPAHCPRALPPQLAAAQLMCLKFDRSAQ